MLKPVFRIISKAMSILRPAPAASADNDRAGLSGVSRPAGVDLEKWISRINSKGVVYADIPAEAVERLRALFPERVKKTLTAADRVVEHVFDILGSGPFSPFDTDRGARADGYRPIDWCLDPVRGLRFPKGIHYKKWNLYEMRPSNADIKYPWELGRLQGLATLGQAWRLTGNPEYALEIFNQLDDFNEANPVGYGVNWTCTMDVAIRSANIAIALGLIRDFAAPAGAWVAAYSSLFDHGRFIYENFENKYEVTSNHYLSNITGLFYTGAVFREFGEGRQWYDYCRRELEKEIHVQIYEEGADFESSVPYHRLVTELFLGPACLAARLDEPMTESYLEKLGTMAEFLKNVMRPDGLMPQIGDADDGRLHIMTNYDSWNPQDARHIFGPASFLLNKPALAEIGGEAGMWEAAWWGFDVSGRIAPPSPLPPVFAAYPESGIHVFRDHGTFLLVTNGKVGTKGFGNHKHNELLSFEYHLGGEAVVVDPGSYVYTSDFAGRNLFRGTAYHNTLMVDGAEQNEMNPEWLFRMFEKADPKTIEWRETDDFIIYRGAQNGYSRFPGAVIHERLIKLRKKDGALLIEDAAAGDGRHDFSWHFHLAPGLRAEPAGNGYVKISGGAAEMWLAAPEKADIKITEAWYSPSYGKRVKCLALDLKLAVDLAVESRWVFAIARDKRWIESGYGLEDARSL